MKRYLPDGAFEQNGRFYGPYKLSVRGRYTTRSQGPFAWLGGSSAARRKEYHRIYRLMLPEVRQKQRQERWKVIKDKVLRHYSEGDPCCRSCNFADIRALTLDHIAGNGAEHRRAIGLGSGQAFYEWIIKNSFPPGFQVLCANCQFIKRSEQNETVLNQKR